MSYSIVHKTFYSLAGSSGTITIPATSAGNVLIAVANGYPASGGQKWTTPNFLKSNIDGAFTQVPFYSLLGGVANDWAIESGSQCAVDISYVVTAGGATQIQFNSDKAVYGLTIFEISGLPTPVQIDDFKVSGSGSVIPLVGPALAGTQSNDLLFLVIGTLTDGVNAVSAPWTLDSVAFSGLGNGGAYILGGSGTQPGATFTEDLGETSDAFTCGAVAFKGGSSGPNISGVSAICGTTGDHVTLTGSSFGASQGLSTVTFNGVNASILSWSDTAITAAVPNGATTGNIVVTVGGTPSAGKPFQIPCIAPAILHSAILPCVFPGNPVPTALPFGFTTEPNTTLIALIAGPAIVDWSGAQLHTFKTDAGDIFQPVAGTSTQMSPVVPNNPPRGVNIFWVPSGVGGATQIESVISDLDFDMWIFEVQGVTGVAATSGLNGGGTSTTPFTIDGGAAALFLAICNISDDLQTVNNPWTKEPTDSSVTMCFGWHFGYAAAHLIGSGIQGPVFQTATSQGYTVVAAAFSLNTSPPPPNFPAPPGGDRFKLTPSPTSGPVQNIPLDNAPNQTWNISVNVDGNPIPLKLVLRYNEIAAYWVATIFDGQGNLLLDSIPFITGAGISQNLLAQFPYLEIGSATIFNASQQA